MRWERGDSPTLMGSNREGIVALELERRVEWNLKYWGRGGFKGACRGKETWGGASDEAL